MDDLVGLAARVFNGVESRAFLLDAIRSRSAVPEHIDAHEEPWRALSEWLREEPDTRVPAMLAAAIEVHPDDSLWRDLLERVPLPPGAVLTEPEPLVKGRSRRSIDVTDLKTAPASAEVRTATDGPGLAEALRAERESQASDAANAASDEDVADVVVGDDDGHVDILRQPPATIDELLARYAADRRATLTDVVREAVLLAAATARAREADAVVDASMLLAALLEAGARASLGSVLAIRDSLLGESPTDAAGPSFDRGAVRVMLETATMPAADGAADVPVSGDVAAVLAAAAALARSVANTPAVVHIDARHVLTALLAAEPVAPPNDARRRLAAFGVDVDPLRRHLLAALEAGDEAAAEAGDVWRAVLTAPDLPAEAGYRSDRVDRDAPDLLDIDQEVRAICGVLGARHVSPPLSLGLFGDWGTGKSFFMAKMQNCIDDMAALSRELERARRTPPFCSRVVQIEFNAWHYADSNLWACLVSEIFDALHSEFGGGSAAAAAAEVHLDRELKAARGMVQEAQRELKEAGDNVIAAKQVLARKVDERHAAERTARALFADVPSLLANDAPALTALTDAAHRLGYVEAARSYDELERATTELRGVGARLQSIVRLLLHSPFSWRMLPLLALALLLPPVIGWMVASFTAIDAVGARVVEFATLIIAFGGWLGEQLRHAGGLAGRMEDALVASRKRREDRERDATADVRQAVEVAAEEEAAARRRLVEARAEQQRLEAEVAEYQPGRQLQRLIEERARAGDYTKHLGIVSMIRKDFQKMSELLPRLAERRDGVQQPPIQRIILYVDDLDRCAPDRVVEVLEAVHLLMAFPLFVVVVGVDPRWLRRCLELHHSHLLSDDEPAAARSGEPAARRSTPQDYLEKIFQIPFALRPIETSGYKRMVSDLLTARPAAEQSLIVVEAAAGQNGAAADAVGGATAEVQPADADGTTAGPNMAASADAAHGNGTEAERTAAAHSAKPAASAAADAADGAAAEVDADARTGGETESDAASSAGPAAATRVINLDLVTSAQLSFRSWEAADMQALAPFFRTPRSVKRFVNVYRLVRAGLRPHQIAEFEGTREAPGQYRAALVFLAIVTGFPNAAPRLLLDFHDWLRRDQPRVPDGTLWDGFVATLATPRPPATGATTRAAETDTPVAGSGNQAVDSSSPAAGAMARSADSGTPAAVEWSRLCSVLTAHTANGFVDATGEQLRYWARTTSRYSFSVNLRALL